jgi:hypothetical protein
MSAPVRAVAAPTEPQEFVGTARLKTRDIFEEAAEFAALKAISARRDAQMQQMEAELRRKGAAVKARDEQIAALKRCCEELQRRARCASLSADDGLGQLGAEVELRTPRPLRGLAREDTGVRQRKVIHEATGDEKCLPGYSRLVSTPSTSCSIARSDLEEELVTSLCGSAAQEGTDKVDAKFHEYFARFPDFKLLVKRLKPG